MKKNTLMRIMLCIGLTTVSINYASQPQNQGMWNWITAKFAGIYNSIPSVNFYEWATNLVKRLTLDQRHMLSGILRAALGDDQQEQDIKKPVARLLHLKSASKSKTEQEIKNTEEELNLLVIPKTVSVRKDTLENIEKELGFEEVNSKWIWDKNNYKNVIVFIRQEEDNWNILGSHNNINMIKCQLFTRNIYPILKGVNTRGSFEVDIMFPILNNKKNNSFGLKNRTGLDYYSGIMKKYIDECRLEKIWPEKVKKELPQSSKKDYGYGPQHQVKKKIE